MIKLDNTLLLGHRGARSEALENTLFGFEHAYKLQAQGLSGVEFDVQLTADGHLVIFHDETLQRLCGLQSRVDQLSLIEIQRQLQLGHKIMTLDMLAQSMTYSSTIFSQPQVPKDLVTQVTETTKIAKTQNHKITLPALTQFTHIELEIKTHNRTNYSKLIQALIRYLVGTPLASLPIVLTTFDVQLLAQLQCNKLLANIPRGLLVRTPHSIVSAPNTALQLGCTQLGIHYPLITKSIIQNAHRYGLPVSAWTVNDIEIAKKLVEWQVDVIITDIPSQLL
ncbi:glycerophosphodiester phosphodiesterase [Psychrobacter sp. FBL11]|uniref:Glycerophosphodiester phosphodiesterase n=1 Tax=Psychrobacter saeujeotis TaxID=3143436 RepID=A0ABU9X725_9GAMM|nr:glycerophosphodiester phosphodiesterase [uncultured Psychrobacter sp.]